MKAYRVVGYRTYIEKLINYLLIIYEILLRLYSMQTSHKIHVSDLSDNINRVKYHGSQFFYLLLLKPNKILYLFYYYYIIKYVQINIIIYSLNKTFRTYMNNNFYFYTYFISLRVFFGYIILRYPLLFFMINLRRPCQNNIIS